MSVGLRVVEVRRPLAEMVRGSFEYAVDEVARAFRAQFYGDEYLDRPRGGEEFWPVETLPDALIVREYENDEAGPDEFFRIPYARDADGKIVFGAREAWEPVALVYQARSGERESGGAGEGEMSEGRDPSRPGAQDDKTRRKRLEERVVLPLAELAADGGKGSRRLKIRGLMTAETVNGNRRRYSAAVLEAAVATWRNHLHESAGQGRLKILTGEAEHPEAKGHRGAQFLETVVRWTEVGFDGTSVDVAGDLILTTKGRDVATLIDAGVLPGGSVRGFYEAKVVKGQDGKPIEEVLWCEITGADLVGEPSFENVVELAESKQKRKPEACGTDGTDEGDDEMDAEKLAELIKAHPELFKGVVAESVKEMTDEQRKGLEEQVRKALGVDDKADLASELAEAAQARRELVESKRLAAVDAAIVAETKSLPYGKELTEAFVKAVRDAKPASPEAVKAMVESKRAEYDALASAIKLTRMGKDLQVLGPVLERETGVPEFARGAFEFSEAMVKRGIAPRVDLRAPKTINEIVAARVIEHFDKMYAKPLLREAKLLETGELSTDLNIPYSASRAILAAVWPQLVATSIFDVDVTEQSPTRVYYEAYANISGKHVAITNESVALTGTGLDAWKALAHKMIEPGTVVVQASTGPSGTLYVEGTDYMVNYLTGEIYCPSGVTIGATDTLYMNYHYDSIREGENQAIQRAKATLSYVTLDCQANRLATEITNEAIVFSRSQLGWDATARTLAMLVSELRRQIDKALMYNALSMALTVASNSGGTWTSSTDPLIDLVGYIGTSKVKVAKRYYEPNWVLLSLTNADTLANWDGFTAGGQRADSELMANGFIGRLKGLPVFASTEFSDSYALVGNRQIVHYRIYQPMALKGPYPSYSSNNLIAADQWYAEQFDGSASPVAGKASYVKVA